MFKNSNYNPINQELDSENEVQKQIFTALLWLQSKLRTQNSALFLRNGRADYLRVEEHDLVRIKCQKLR